MGIRSKWDILRKKKSKMKHPKLYMVHLNVDVSTSGVNIFLRGQKDMFAPALLWIRGLTAPAAPRFQRRCDGLTCWDTLVILSHAKLRFKEARKPLGSRTQRKPLGAVFPLSRDRNLVTTKASPADTTHVNGFTTFLAQLAEYLNWVFRKTPAIGVPNRCSLTFTTIWRRTLRDKSPGGILPRSQKGRIIGAMIE